MFDLTGYAVYVMFLEYLTHADGNTCHETQMEMDLIAGDFGVPVTVLRDILSYCDRLGLLKIEGGKIWSPGLMDRLKPVFDKRERAAARAANQNRENGQFANFATEHLVNTTETPVTVTETPVTVTEMPQSKVKESNTNTFSLSNSESGKIETSQNPENFTRPMTPESCTVILTGPEVKAAVEIYHLRNKILLAENDLQDFFMAFKLQTLDGKKFYPDRVEMIKHFKNWLPTQIFNKNKNHHQNGKQQPTAAERRHEAYANIFKRGENFKMPDPGND